MLCPAAVLLPVRRPHNPLRRGCLLYPQVTSQVARGDALLKFTGHALIFIRKLSKRFSFRRAGSQLADENAILRIDPKLFYPLFDVFH